MSYEPLPARELLPFYPERTQEMYTAAHIGDADWENLSRDEKYARLQSTLGTVTLTSFPLDDLRGEIHVMPELLNATGSHCDRQLGSMQRMEQDGLLVPSVTTIDETTSGSLGSQLAIHAPLMGYQLHVRTPELTQKRRATMQYPGVDLEIVEGYIPEAARAMQLRLAELKKLDWTVQKQYTKDYRAFSATHPNGREHGHIVFPNHSANPITIDCARPIGNKMAAGLAEKDITLDAMLLVIGNGTSIHGIAPVIRQYQPQAKIYGIETALNAPTYNRFYAIPPELQRYERHDSYGSSADGTPLAYKADRLLDGVAIVAPQPRDIVRDQFNAQHPDMAIGNTSAMALKVARDIVQQLNKKNGAHIGLIFYDGVDRY